MPFCTNFNPVNYQILLFTNVDLLSNPVNSYQILRLLFTSRAFNPVVYQIDLLLRTPPQS
jgi:hypothetical protein